MLTLLETHRDALNTLCARYFVERLAVFGSAAREEDFSETSDLDFLVVFAPMTPTEHKNAYFGLWFALEDLFGRSVDLVTAGAIKNPYVKRTIEKDQKTLYAAA